MNRLERTTFVLVTVLSMWISMAGPARAWGWFLPDHGVAHLTTYYGWPSSSIAQFNQTGNSLLLGVLSDVYASATASGSMWIEAIATATGWVTATMRWYIRGAMGGGGIGYYDMTITVKFVVYDKSADASTETVLLSANGVWLDPGTLREDTIDVPLYDGHHYDFKLVAEAHAHTQGLCGVYSDFGAYGWMTV